MSAPYRVLRDRYELRSELGSGGMGVVWRAFDQILERDVAIKQIHIGTNEALAKRTVREARITAKINHPNIVRIHDFFLEDGKYYSVMELIEGSSLDQLIARKMLTPFGIRRMLSEIATALAVAHRHGIAHRDVKPQNIIVDIDGHAHLVDFGISRTMDNTRLTQEGAVIGTLAFMPPEVLSTQTATYASDVWALGATVYCCFEGRPPFGTDHGGLNTQALAAGTAPAATHAGDLVDILDSMLAKDPDKRPTAPEVVQFLEHASTATLPPRPVPLFPPLPPMTSSLPAAPTHTGPSRPDVWLPNPTPPPPPPGSPRQDTPPPGPSVSGPPRPEKWPPARPDTPPRSGSHSASAKAGSSISGPSQPERWPLAPASVPALGPIRQDTPPPGSGHPWAPTPPPDGDPPAAGTARKSRRKLVAVVTVAVLAMAGTTAYLLTRPPADPGTAAAASGSASAAAAAAAAPAFLPVGEVNAAGQAPHRDGESPADPRGDGSAVCAAGTAIAITGDLAGPFSPLGRRNALDGAKFAVDQHNRANAGCQVELKTFDSTGSPKTATTMASSIVDDPAVMGVIGPLFTGEIAAAGAIYAEGGLLAMTPSATDPSLATKGWTNFFRGVANYMVQGPAIANALTGQLGATKVCVVHDDSTYGVALADAVTSTLGSVADGSCAAEVRSGVKDFSPVVQSIAAARPDAVVYGGYYPEAGLLVQQLRAAGVEGAFATGDGVFDPQFIKNAGDAAIGAYSTCPCAPIPDALSAEFQAAFGTEPGMYTTEGYDIATIMLKAIGSGVTDRKGMIDYVHAYSGEGFARHYQWDSTGELVDPTVWVYQVK